MLTRPPRTHALMHLAEVVSALEGPLHLSVHLTIVPNVNARWGFHPPRNAKNAALLGPWSEDRPACTQGCCSTKRDAWISIDQLKNQSIDIALVNQPDLVTLLLHNLTTGKTTEVAKKHR